MGADRDTGQARQDDNRALRARLAERLTAHLTVSRSSLEAGKLADLIAIAYGVIPAGNC
jgi:hypothetical protein